MLRYRKVIKSFSIVHRWVHCPCQSLESVLLLPTIAT